METIKTAVVVVLLLAVLYGVYVMLNKPEATGPKEAWDAQPMGPPEVDTGKSDPGRTVPPRALRKSEPGLLATDSEGPLSARGSSFAEAPAGPNPVIRAGGVTADKPGAGGPPGETGRDARLGPPALFASRPGSAEPQPTLADPPAEPSPSPRADAAAQEAGAVPANALADAGKPARSSPLRFSEAKDPEFRTVRAFDNAWTSAVAQLNRQQWAEALLTLSLFYNSGEATAEEHQRLVDLLDPLAGKVIYSKEHLLERPCEVRPGETLADIAQQLQVPPTLLQNINGLPNSANLPPGTTLKVVRGPFRAEVDLKKNELVLFAGKYYAGRFAISVGNDPAPRPAEYQVLDKREGREYRGADGARIPAGTPDNPYGRWWIDLGDNVCIHATPDSLPPSGSLGCVSLNSRDAADVYAILSRGSRVSIR